MDNITQKTLRDIKSAKITSLVWIIMHVICEIFLIKYMFWMLGDYGIGILFYLLIPLFNLYPFVSTILLLRKDIKITYSLVKEKRIAYISQTILNSILIVFRTRYTFIVFV